MLRFLRRSRGSIVEEGNVRKYLIYALGEILLVVLGILIAVQINNWNQTNKDRQNEQFILSELQKEFIANEAIISTQIDGLEKAIAYNKDYLDKLVNGSLDYQAIYDFNAGAQIIVGTSHPSSGVYDTIISTGEIGLIQNDSLRYLLPKWKDTLENFMENEALHLDFFLNEFLVYVSEHFLRASYQQERLDFFDLSEREINEAYMLSAKKTKYRSYVVNNLDWMEGLLITTNNTREELLRVLALIESEIDG